MKVLIFTKYSRLGASSRMRLLQYLPFFELNGIDCDVQPLLNDLYLQQLYSGKAVNKWNIIKSYFNRIIKLFGVKKYDAVIIEKELFPFFPPCAEWWLRSRKVRYMVDYDDAIFHNYDLNAYYIVRVLLGNKIKGVIRNAFAVVCGNAYLAEYARMAAAKEVIIIPTVIDVDRYEDKKPIISEEVRIGWIGSPSTLFYVKQLKPVIEDLGERHRIKLCLMGGNASLGLGDLEEKVQWSEDSEANYINSFDIGIMPLDDSPWSKGKCGYKLIQYMGCGLPVVGSPVGVNDLIIEEGVNGFKPGTAQEWTTALELLIIDGDLRRSMGESGRRMAREKYSLEKTSEIWLNLIRSSKQR